MSIWKIDATMDSLFNTHVWWRCIYKKGAIVPSLKQDTVCTGRKALRHRCSSCEESRNLPLSAGLKQTSIGLRVPACPLCHLQSPLSTLIGAAVSH